MAENQAKPQTDSKQRTESPSAVVREDLHTASSMYKSLEVDPPLSWLLNGSLERDLEAEAPS